MIVATRLIALVTLLLSAMTAFGQVADPVAQLVIPKSAKLGKQVKAKIKITFGPGLHGYQNPPTKEYQIPIEIKSATKGVTIKAVYPKGEVKEFMGEAAAVYEGTIEIPVLITLPKKVGAHTFKLEVGYQLCNEEACFPPGTINLTGKLTVSR